METHQPETLDGMRIVEPYHAAAFPAPFIGLLTEVSVQEAGWAGAPSCAFLCRYRLKFQPGNQNFPLPFFLPGHPEGEAMKLSVNPDQLWPKLSQYHWARPG